jgi:hypothetical protein
MTGGPPRADRPLSATEFFALAAARLSLNSPDEPAGGHLSRHVDHDADPAVMAAIGAMPIRAAAVLVPVIARAEPTVLFTRRTAHLVDHAGQIAFPGGKIEAADASPAAAALREAEEEIALAPGRGAITRDTADH